MNNPEITADEVNAALQHMTTHPGQTHTTADALVHLDVNTLSALLESWNEPHPT